MRDFRDLLKRADGSNNHFEKIELNRDGNSISMSIQASRHNYSAPRQDGLQPHDYREFEVAFLRDDKFVNPIDINFGYDQVLAYVSTEEVQRLFQKFMSLTAEQIKQCPQVELGTWEDDE